MWKFVVVTLLVGVPIIAFSSLAQNKLVPVLNKSPKHFVEFRVCKSANILKPIMVTLNSFYFTRNEACSLIANAFEGVKYAREKNLYYKLQLKKTERCATKKIPLDGLNMGYCLWKISTFGFQFLPYGKQLDYDGETDVKPVKHCQQYTESNYYVTRDNKIIQVINKPKYGELGLNCKNQVYQLNIRIK